MRYDNKDASEVTSLGSTVKEQFLPPREQAKALPYSSGVYLMFNKNKKIIYVGKAKSLRKRVTSYFLPNRDPKTTALVKKIVRIEHIITGNEYEALVLENNLIKKYNPHYNIDLKDGKSYPVIRITKGDFPKVFKTRRIINDGSDYYGPFPVAGQLDIYLDLIDKMYKVIKCAYPMKKRKNPCLYYHIGKCDAPCCGKVSKEEYGKAITEIKKLFSGDNDRLIKQTEKEMLAASKELDFETAAQKRDLLNSLLTISSRQQVEDFVQEARDYAAIEMRGPLYTISLMQMRDGALMGRALYRGETFGDETDTLFSFLMRYYSDGQKLPTELFVSHHIDSDLLATYFEKEFKGKLSVSVPIDGKHYRVLRMAHENASRDVEKRLKNTDNTAAVKELQDILELQKPPSLIEGFDIAQLSGKYTVASLISFRDGNPDKANYRRFNIRSLEGKIDDFEAMREAAARRYSRVLNDNLEHPDLIVCDGGKGQVNAVCEVLDSLGIVDIPVIGLAERYEEIIFSDNRQSLLLPEHSPALRILIAVRDECHRFATTANQNLRSKELAFKLLEDVKGIGKDRSERLMKAYGSVDEILKHTPEEISEKANIPITVSKRLIQKLDL
ncbi:MAG: excinuclease ABC subunit UvrC [Sphaerochaeta sp.]|jgi:excinuclease ABC subunit C